MPLSSLFNMEIAHKTEEVIYGKVFTIHPKIIYKTIASQAHMVWWQRPSKYYLGLRATH